MYTKEQKEAALELYHQLGSVTAVVRKMGYPTRETLHLWIKTEGKLKNKRKEMELVNTVEHPRNPPAETKISIIKRCFEYGESVKSVSEETGYTRATIYSWRKKYLKEGAAGLMNTKNIQPGKLEPGNPPDPKDEEIQGLREQVLQMRMEIDILKESIGLLKKDLGVDAASLKNREKVVVINALKDKYPLPDLLKSLGMAKSSYYYQKSIMACPDKYTALRKKIEGLFRDSQGRYGYRRLHGSLRNEGIKVSEKVIRRIMSEGGMSVKTRKHRKYNSYKGEITPAVPDLVKRDFHSDKPNQKWLTDITEFALPAGKVYLSPIVDCFDGMLVCWRIGTSPDASLVNGMLDEAIGSLSPDEHPIIHSDRGCHYRWPGWIQRMDSAGLLRSMSRKGCSPDNAACEGLFGRLKNEMFYNRDWMDVSIKEFIHVLDGYLMWYNEKRIKQSLGYKSPKGYRQSLGLVA